LRKLQPSKKIDYCEAFDQTLGRGEPVARDGETGECGVKYELEKKAAENKS